jgi:hypothetical protein
MEFMSRGGSTPAPQHNASAAAEHKKKKFNLFSGRAVSLEVFVLFVVGIALALLCAYLVITSWPRSSESGQVNTSKYQAVFLNGGATSGSVAYTTYFGHITSLNNNYLVLKDVYYLTTSSTSSSDQTANPQLTKLGCQQLHSPYDEMVINRSQVAFWENLQDNGKVAQAIKQFVQQNPNGPNCSATSSSSSSNSSAQNSSSTTP